MFSVLRLNYDADNNLSEKQKDMSFSEPSTDYNKYPMSVQNLLYHYLTFFSLSARTTTPKKFLLLFYQSLIITKRSYFSMR
jgi:hypothetical protein